MKKISAYIVVFIAIQMWVTEWHCSKRQNKAEVVNCQQSTTFHQEKNICGLFQWMKQHKKHINQLFKS